MSNFDAVVFNTIAQRAGVIDIQKYGRLFFAIAMVAFGAQHFIFGDFITGRAPAWPRSIPGRLVWAYLSGVIFIVAAIAMLIEWKAKEACIILGTVIFLWAFLRNIPVAAADPGFGVAWTNAGKALALFGGAYAVVATFPGGNKRNRFSAFVNSKKGFLYLGRIGLGLFMILCGIQHFLFTKFVQMLVPAWIPGAYFWTYFAGVALIAGGIGLMLKKTARLAATLSGIMIFIWFIILHIPRAVAAANSENEWIAVVEALAMSGIAFVLAGSGKKDL